MVSSRVHRQAHASPAEKFRLLHGASCPLFTKLLRILYTAVTRSRPALAILSCVDVSYRPTPHQGWRSHATVASRSHHNDDASCRLEGDQQCLSGAIRWFPHACMPDRQRSGGACSSPLSWSGSCSAICWYGGCRGPRQPPHDRPRAPSAGLPHWNKSRHWCVYTEREGHTRAGVKPGTTRVAPHDVVRVPKIRASGNQVFP